MNPNCDLSTAMGVMGLRIYNLHYLTYVVCLQSNINNWSIVVPEKKIEYDIALYFFLITFQYDCFEPSFVIFGGVVLENKSKMYIKKPTTKKTNGWQKQVIRKSSIEQVQVYSKKLLSIYSIHDTGKLTHAEFFLHI